MRLYFAGPLFCESERVFNARLAAEIEKLAYDVFLPQRDGLEADQTHLVGNSIHTLGAVNAASHGQQSLEIDGVASVVIAGDVGTDAVRLRSLDARADPTSGLVGLPGRW